MVEVKGIKATQIALTDPFMGSANVKQIIYIIQ